MYPLVPLCSHMRGGSKKMIKMSRLSVSTCMVPCCMSIGCVWPKYSLVYVVVDCE